MASVTMTAAFLVGKSLVVPSAPRRSVVMASCAATPAEGQNVGAKVTKKESSINGRRDLMFAAATAALCSVAGKAMADEEEPRRGSEEAKKKYAQVCVTMPTARICRY